MDEHSPTASVSARPRRPLPTAIPLLPWPGLQCRTRTAGTLPDGIGKGAAAAAVVPSGSLRALPGPAAGRFLSTGFPFQRPLFQSGHWAWEFR